MNDSHFSPAPWRQRRAANESAATTIDDGQGRPIAHALPVSGGNIDTRDGNAALITAAPELLHSQRMSLEALIAQRKWMGERPVNPQYPYHIAAALLCDALDISIATARTAIDKAAPNPPRDLSHIKHRLS